MVVLGSAGTAQATDRDEVNVCHATSSGANPYEFLTLPVNAVDGNGVNDHMMHRDHPNKTWAEDSWWNGEFYEAGDPRPDFINSYTKDGEVYQADGQQVTQSWCESGSTGEKVVTPDAFTVEPATCTADGALVPQEQPEGVDVTWSPSGRGPGEYVVTYTPERGYQLTQVDGIDIGSDGIGTQYITVDAKLPQDACTQAEPVDVTVEFVPDCKATNAWKITNEGGPSVSVSYPGGSVMLAEGEMHEFSTEPQSDRVEVTWGDGKFVQVGKAEASAGDDRGDCVGSEQPDPVEIDLVFVADCSPTNQWLITNGSDQAVDVTINDGQPVNIPAGGQHPFSTGAGVNSVTAAWGGEGTGIAEGSETVGAGDDLSDCGPNIPQKPQGSTSVVSENRVDCFAEEVVTTTTTTVVDYVWNGEVWQRTEKVSTSTAKVGATPDELNNADCPIPAQPTPDLGRAVEKDVDCDDKVVTVTTTITTTPYVWFESTREWVPGEAEIETIVDERKPRGNECPRVLPAEGEKPDKNPVTKPDNDGVAGVDAERPRPEPVVAAQPEALPTAVDAGLAPVATSASSPLGQGLLAGGLVMLVLAGALQAGRRERGAHEV